jgi:predicted dienelactone hydrolase
MFTRRLAVVVLIALFWTGVASAADNSGPYHVGETSRLFHPGVVRNWRGAQTEALLTRIWYPINPEIAEFGHDIGAPGAPIFRGHPAADNAPLSARHPKYPLLLLSHGTGGSADSLDWLAAALAANGYVVAGVNHPGNNATEPLTREGFTLWWERATDVSEVLDGIMADPMLSVHIDASRIGAVGFSLGGYTVLELAGARTNFKAFERFCQSTAADAICRPPEMDRLKDTADVPKGGSPEMLASIARAGASYRDKRIKAVFAIAPALGEAFDGASFADVHLPVFLIAGTADVTVPVETNVRRVAGFMRDARLVMLSGAAHYTFLDTCLTASVERLASICKDGPGVDRDAIHRQTVEQVLTFFMSALPGRPL